MNERRLQQRIEEVDRRAEELADSWVNGNQGYVISLLMDTIRGPRRVVLAVKIYRRLVEIADDHGGEKFLDRLTRWALTD